MRKRTKEPHLRDLRVGSIISHDAPESDEGGFAENKRANKSAMNHVLICRRRVIVQTGQAR